MCRHTGECIGDGVILSLWEWTEERFKILSEYRTGAPNRAIDVDFRVITDPNPIRVKTMESLKYSIFTYKKNKDKKKKKRTDTTTTKAN